MLQILDHPHIVHVLELLTDSKNVYFVMELVEHGNLMEVYEKVIKNNWSFTERDAANIVRQILMALNYMHREGVIHRDLKMENVMVDVMLDCKGENALMCKLTDFGLSAILDGNEYSRGFMGTPMYMAPEIINRKSYTNKVDTWALGVLAYVLLSGGHFPFNGRREVDIYHRITEAKPDLSVLDKYTNSATLKDFISHCLDSNPNTRYSCEELLNHGWLKCICSMQIPEAELKTIGNNFWDF